MLSSFVLAETLIRTLAPPPGSRHVRPPIAASTVNPLESADPKNASVTPLQSADPKTKHLKGDLCLDKVKGVSHDETP